MSGGYYEVRENNEQEGWDVLGPPGSAGVTDDGHPTDERAYTVAAMLVDHDSVIRRDFWQGVAAVRDLVDGPEVDDLPNRDGHVVHYTVEFAARLVP